MSPPNPTHPLSIPEQIIFGQSARRHPITGYPLEQGAGALSDNEQAEQHCRAIEVAEGKEVANAIRRKLGFPIAEEVAAVKAKLERERVEREKAAYAALAEKEAAEATKAQAAPVPLPSASVH